MTKLRPVFIDENGYTADKQFVVVNRAWLISRTGSLEIDQPPESVFASTEPVGYVPEYMLKDMKCGRIHCCSLEPKWEDRNLIPVFAHPPAPKPDVLLSGEEKKS